MKNLEQITAEITEKAQKEIARAQKECQIRELLPIQPEFVHLHNLWTSIGSIKYKVKTKSEALEIAQKFDIIPAFICRDSCVSIKPFDDEKAREVSEIYAWVSIDQFRTELGFYANIGADIMKIFIELPQQLFGHYRKSDPRAKINFTMDWQPLPKTREMFQSIRYARIYHRGPQSGHNVIYAIYDQFELVNQFSGE